MADETEVSQGTPAPENEKPVVETQQAEQTEERTEQPAAEAEGAEHTPEGGESEQKPVRIHSSIQARMDQLTKARREAEREAASLRLKLAQYESGTKPSEGGDGAAAPTTQQPDIETLANQRAQELYRQRIRQERVNSVLSAGNTEYKDFTERCNVVAQLGGADSPDFMAIVTDPSIVPDGHKVIAALADDPNEAARILSLPSVAMSAELARFAERVGKPASPGKQVSRAPAPIRPIAGAAKASDEPSPDDPEDDWFRKREAQRAARAQVGRSL